MSNSNTITVSVIDSTNNPRGKAEIPADATADQVQSALVHKLNLPKFDGRGRPLTYHLRNSRTGQSVSGSRTISSVVKEGDRVQLLPEIIPG